jgi:hypothetical protein
MSKARDLANAGTALTTVSPTELGYLDGVTSAVQTQIDAKLATSTASSTYEPVLPSQTGNTGKYLTTDGSAKSWGTVSQYALPSQTGNAGKFLTTNGTAESWGTVTAPIVWTQRAGIDAGINSIAYNGSNLYVAVGSGGTIQTSPDGITWTARTSNAGGNVLVKVAFGNGVWVAVGYNGTLVSSSDGTTWTARTSNSGGNDIYDVTYANSLWVAVGSGGGTTNTGGIIYSTDGTTWTRKSQSVTIGSDYHTVIWNGTNWIVGGNRSTNNFLRATAPSGTWTADVSGNHNIQQLFYDGTRILEIRSDGKVGFSTSSTFGTTTTLLGNYLAPSNVVYTTVYYYNGQIFSLGFGFQAISSTPFTGNFVNTTIPISLSPTTTMLYGGGVSTNARAIFAGSAGYIVASSNPSVIYTSF